MRLIDADALKEKLMQYTWRDEDDCEIDDATDKRKFIDEWFPNVPAIDAVQVVRCKDCKWFRDSNGIDGFCYCDRIFRRCGTHWFCADGERKEDDEQQT